MSGHTYTNRTNLITDVLNAHDAKRAEGKAMKRKTKTMLLDEMASSECFQKLQLMTVSIKHQEVLRGQAGFVPSCCYGPGQVPMRDEIGRTAKTRYLTQPLDAWKP